MHEQLRLFEDEPTVEMPASESPDVMESLRMDNERLRDENTNLRALLSAMIEHARR